MLAMNSTSPTITNSIRKSLPLARLPQNPDVYLLNRDSRDLKAQLICCRSIFRPLGSCGPVLFATSATIRHLGELRELFRRNASTLFPGESPLQWSSTGHKAIKYPNDFPQILARLSADLRELNDSLYCYSEIYRDENLASILIHFSNDLAKLSRHLSSSKSSHKDLTIDVHMSLPHYSKRLQAIERLLAEFLKNGLPIITRAQEDREKRYMTLTAVATFFSAVTATMLQMTYGSNGSSIDTATNALVLSALVFSVTSAVSSFVSMAWYKSVVRSPEHSLPSWASAWLDKWPRASLMLSGMCLFGAICCFVFSSGQSHFTQISIILLSIFSTVTIVFSSIWLIIEETRIFPIHDYRNNLLDKQIFIAYFLSKIIRAFKHFFFGVTDDSRLTHSYDSEAGADELEDSHFYGPPKYAGNEAGGRTIPSLTHNSSVPFVPVIAPIPLEEATYSYSHHTRRAANNQLGRLIHQHDIWHASEHRAETLEHQRILSSLLPTSRSIADNRIPGVEQHLRYGRPVDSRPRH